jgi:hypothetical protein
MWTITRGADHAHLGRHVIGLGARQCEIHFRVRFEQMENQEVRIEVELSCDCFEWRSVRHVPLLIGRHHDMARRQRLCAMRWPLSTSAADAFAARAIDLSRIATGARPREIRFNFCLP